MNLATPEQVHDPEILDSLLGDRLLDLLPSGVYVCDVQGLIVRYNPKAAELWGQEPQLGNSDLRFCGSMRLFWPDGTLLPHEETPMARVLETGEAFHDGEVVIERPDGSRIQVAVNIEPIRDANGVLVGAVNCFQDVTDRRQAERGLQRSEAFLATVIETTPECIKVIARDETLVQMNEAGLRMLSAERPDDVIGSSLSNLIAAEHRELWRENHRRVCEGEMLVWEFDFVGLGGERRHIETHAAPIQLNDGSIGHLGVTRDVTQRKKDERNFRDLLQALPMALYTTDAEGRITFFNPAAEELWGRRPEPGEKWCGSYRLLTPEGHELPHEECPMAVALRERRPVRNREAVLVRSDGTQVPFMPYPTPFLDDSGALTGAVNVLVDTSYHKQAEQRHQLLINELNHRVKNTLTIVQSIAALTSRSTDSPEEFSDSFSSRLAALGRTHDLLTETCWTGIELMQLLERELSPFGVAPAERIRLGGDLVRLQPRHALTLAMAFHELATNAVKHGALSSHEGTVEIAWKVKGENVELKWQERGGPAVSPPNHKGFGSTLLERGVAADLSGAIELDYLPQGLVCMLTFPLDAQD